MPYYFTSESVTEGHPDKIADKIADTLLDECLRQDPNSRCGIEVSLTTNYCLVFGEINTKAILDVEKLVRKTIKEIGYIDKETYFSYKDVKIENKLHMQSSDISLGLDKEDQGAGDQGIMFGYATNETKGYMPIAISYAHQLARRLEYVRKENIIEGLYPDGKTQVTIEYEDNHKPKRIDSIVVSTMHKENKELSLLKEEIIEHVIKNIIPENLLDQNTKYLINPTGRFVIGGPHGDSGLTGRKIIVDTYGGSARHGGGAFSGKDASKVDRSASYMARYLAKNIVASGISEFCEIELSYCIGVSQPVSLYISLDNNTYKEEVYKTIKENFDLSPKGIIKFLDLKKPIYTKTTVYGHFGKSNLNWEKLDSVPIFKKILQK